MPAPKKVALFSKEYPPFVYGGAGVHVEYLARALAKSIDVEVRCFGDQQVTEARLAVRGYPQWEETQRGTDPRFVGAIDAYARSLAMAKDTIDADLVHCHTWYTDMGGVIASKLWGVPSVLTIHSLEPLRPWKVEQLGNAYHLSAWMERTAIMEADAIVAVSRETKADVLRLFDVDPARVHVIHNGIDLDEYRAVSGTDVLTRHGIDPSRPFLLFVGRITRQKGIIHLVNAIPKIDPCSADRAVRRRAGYARDRRGDGDEESPGSPASVRASSGFARCCRARTSFSSTPMLPFSAALRSTSRSGSSTSKRWRAGPPWSQRASVAFPRWWCPKRPVCSLTRDWRLEPSNRPIRRISRTRSPRRSIASPMTRRYGTGWVLPDVSGSRLISVGMPSPTRRFGYTPRCSTNMHTA